MIEGDLDLDDVSADPLVIDGDLAVIGNIINADPDEGRSLHVRGNLRAQNLVAGGASVRVDGDVEIDGLVIRHGESRLRVEGAMHARFVLDADGRPGMPLSGSLHRDIPVERDEEEYPIVLEKVDPQLLIARLRAGQPVLRDPDDPRPRKSYAQWLADCEKFGHAIAHVPRELVTDELVDAALAENPYALQSVPVEFRTAARCRIAVQHKGRMLAEVPAALRTPELCALAIERDTRLYEVMPHIPEEHLTYELCLRAAQRDGLSLSYMPERFRTVEMCVAAMNENMFAISDVPESIRDKVRQAVIGPAVTLTSEERALIERPTKLRLFRFYLRHLWRGFRTRLSAAPPEAPRRD